MRVTMLKTRRGTEDGFTIRQYIAGKDYIMRERLARRFLAAGVAKITENYNPVSHAKAEEDNTK